VQELHPYPQEVTAIFILLTPQNLFYPSMLVDIFNFA
jgi:hypothetical protein